jgi:hypothetical protein
MVSTQRIHLSLFYLYLLFLGFETDFVIIRFGPLYAKSVDLNAKV